MLPTTAQFDAAIDANTTEVDCNVVIEREYNAIADTITVSAVHDPIDDRFNAENVVNIRNPMRNGVATGPVREFFPSSNPLQGYRFIKDKEFDEDPSYQYYIPVNSPNSTRADVTVDYAQNYEMNCVEIRYENSRTQSTYYDETLEIYGTPDGGSETLLGSVTMNTEGSTRLYWNGSTWVTSAGDIVDTGTNLRSIRLKVVQGSYTHQPRIMYIGGLHIIDVSDDIINVSVRKTEFEASAYLPQGDPSGNSCDIELDNTNKRYRFSDNIDENFFLKNQRIIIKFGVNTKYGGGADSYEYVAAGTFYVDDYGYNEEDMTVNISGQDFSKFLQEVFCGDYLWIDKSLKYIVRDTLARSGITPRGIIFDFGVAGNADESNKRAYTWSTEDQTVWQFLSDLAKSEMGTVFYDEEENLVFTDRLDIDSKTLAGVQYTLDAGTNLESIDEEFEVGANKIKVEYEVLEPNTTGENFQLVIDNENVPQYQLGPEVPLNQVLWQPSGEEGYLGSARLSRTLKPGHTYLYVDSETALQITRKEGEVLVGDEFIEYKDRTDMPSGEGRLTITKRDARNTVFNGQIPTYKASNYNLRKHVKYPRSLFPSGAPAFAQTFLTNDGLRMRHRTPDNKYMNVVQCLEIESDQVTYESNYRVYHVRFRFNEMPGRFQKDQAAGLFMNLNRQKRGIFFEISNPARPEMVQDGIQGNVRAYKIDDYMGPVPMPPNPAENVEGFRKSILYSEAVLTGADQNDGTYIDMTVLQVEEENADRIDWYVNGEFIDTFKTEYAYQYLKDLRYSNHEAVVGSNWTRNGRFGFFTRGSTDATIDFIYASNDNTIGPDEVLQTRGFRKYFDAHTNSWNVKREYLKGREYYVEFGIPVHEVQAYNADHDTFPNLYARVLNTDEDTVSVLKASHNPFSSNLLVANTARIGINLNDTVFYPDGSTLDHSFLLYGLGIVRSEKNDVTTLDSASIRRYGEEEVVMSNPWINSKEQAISLAKHVRKFWSVPQQFFDVQSMATPALQPRDRVSVIYTDKGFDSSGVWLVNGITITYDGGLSTNLRLKRYREYPTGDFDYREDGGIVV